MCGHRGINWEIGTEVCALPCVKQIASGKLLSSTRMVLCDDLEGWDGRGWGEAQEGGYKYAYSGFTLLYSRN